MANKMKWSLPIWNLMTEVAIPKTKIVGFQEDPSTLAQYLIFTIPLRDTNIPKLSASRAKKAVTKLLILTHNQIIIIQAIHTISNQKLNKSINNTIMGTNSEEIPMAEHNSSGNKWKEAIIMNNMNHHMARWAISLKRMS